MNGYIDDVKGIKVGHYTNKEAMTGSTVILFENGARCAVDVRGGAPGTRETDLLKPGFLVDKINAILLTGGSAFGLDAASGVMNILEENKMGFKTPFAYIPIVPAAVIYDLGLGNGDRPDFNYGKAAAINAIEKSESQRLEGSVGAGTGASVGKILGMEYAMKSGIGSYSIRLDDIIVSALIVVNAFGDIYDKTGKEQIAGPRNISKNEIYSTEEIMLSKKFENKIFENTTIGVIATNARLTKSELQRLCIAGHDAFARSIRPVHTMSDGDTLFSVSTSNLEANLDILMVMASKAVSAAIESAIKKA